MLTPKAPTIRTALLADIHTFVREAGMAESTLGRNACGSAHAVPNLRAGRSTLRTMERLERYMAEERTKRRIVTPPAPRPGLFGRWRRWLRRREKTS